MNQSEFNRENPPLTRFLFYVSINLVMKLFSALKSNAKGFTLIELLVVIGILGILAAALVATIDPFEQLNKAQDANSKNTAVEFLNANIRYYTTHSAMPWWTNGATCMGASVTTLSAVNLSSNSSMYSTCLSTLINEGELKQAFTTATGILGNLYANESNGNITMCYKPKSKSQQRDVSSKYVDAAATTGAACPGGPTNPVNGTCFWCTQ